MQGEDLNAKDCETPYPTEDWTCVAWSHSLVMDAFALATGAGSSAVRGYVKGCAYYAHVHCPMLCLRCLVASNSAIASTVRPATSNALGQTATNPSRLFWRVSGTHVLLAA